MLLRKRFLVRAFNNGDSTTTTGGGDPPPNDQEKPTLSQKKVDEILAKEKRKHQAELQKSIEQLEQLKKAKGLTEEERQGLETRIEELNGQLLTKDQLLTREREKLTKEAKEREEKLTGESKRNWSLFENASIGYAISSEAAKAEAFNVDQIALVLKPITALVEDKDSAGQGLGTYTPRVKFPDTDQKGAKIVLDLTVAEAVKRMKELPAQYGNLFKSGVAGGLGASGGTGGGKGHDANNPPKDPVAYREWRKQQGLEKK